MARSLPRRARLLLGAAVAVPLALAGPGAAAAGGAGEATVSVLHAVPGLTVDVYANGEELLSDFEPGTLTDPQQLPAGDYDLAVFEAGADPDSADPAISADGVGVPADANITVVAHLSADGTPTLTPFVNDTSAVEAGQARLTVRHTAAAPAVDVLAGGDPVVTGLENPDEESLTVPAGTVSAAVAAAGTTDPVIGPADLDLAEGTLTAVYAWGSLDEGTLDLAVQTVDGLDSAPGGVPSGEAGLAGTGAPAWVVATSVAALAGAVLLGLAATTRRRGTAPAGRR